MSDFVNLEYTIHLTDKALVEELQQGKAWRHSPYGDPPTASADFSQINSIIWQSMRGKVFGSPASAALKWGAPIIPVGAQFSAPCITSPWIVALNQTMLNPADDKHAASTRVYDILGVPVPEGSNVNVDQVRWIGRFAYAPPGDTDQNGGPLGDMMQREWIEGFEMPMQGEGSAGAGGASPYRSRDSSRHPDGYGLAIRGQDGIVSHALAVNATSLWQRLYVRARSFPTGEVEFWGQHVDDSALAGISLAMQSTGRVSIKNVDGAGARTTLATTTDPFVIDEWVRLDLLIESGVSAKVRLFQRGILIITVDSPPGLAAGTHLNTAFVGTELNTSARALGLDIDDWIAAKMPTSLDGIDFLNGSKVKRIEAKAFHADNDSNWDGDWRAALQNPADDGSEVLTSAVSGAVLAVETNAELALDAEVQSLGVAALTVGVESERDGVADGTLGFSIAGAAFDMAAITQQNTPNWASRSYFPSGLQNPQAITPVALKHTKGASTDPSIVYALAAVAELVGVFGAEDVVLDEGNQPDAVPVPIPVHNSPYPTSPWARKTVKPLAPVRIEGRLYTGNGTAQDLTFDIPIHWIWVRNIGGAQEGWTWFSSLLATHGEFTQVSAPAAGVSIGLDPDYVAGTEEDAQVSQTILRIVGDDARWNANGDTYQMIVVADPAMRFMFNRALRYPRGTADKTTPFLNTQFLPVASFFWQEVINGSADYKMFWQGPGHGDAVSPPNGASVADAVEIDRGSLKSKTGLHFSGAGAQIPFSLFREDDRSTDPGKVNVLNAISYVGDGASPRTVVVNAETNRRPMFALVQPTDGKGYFRDPSHTGTTSTDGEYGAIAANGIRGGDVGSIIVGSDLNANGKTYSVFVLWGVEDCEGESGWSCNGVSDPVDPGGWDEDDGGDWDDEPPNDDPPDDGDVDDGSGDDDGDADGGDDTAAGCAGATGGVCNVALSRIGVTKRILDIDTETTVEAEQCRLHYAKVTDATLRAFPWPWATKYAALTLYAGTAETPVNHDWQYSYRKPADCVFARRIVDQSNLRRKVGGDITPEPFREGRDGTVALIYSNLASPVLEYTFRPDCAALTGDAMFRDAQSWRMAAELAPGIGRNKMVTRDCLLMFERRIAEAKATAANEQQHPDDGVGDAPWIRDRG